MESITNAMDMNLVKLWVMVDREAWHAVAHGVVNNWTGLGDRTATTNCWYDTKKGLSLTKRSGKELPRMTAQNHCCPSVIDMFPRVYFGSEVREKKF